MSEKIDEKIGNLKAQSKQVKVEISELEDSLAIRRQLLHKIEGAVEFASSLKEDSKEVKPSKKEKQDA